MKTTTTLLLLFFIPCTGLWAQHYNSLDFDGTDDFVSIPAASSEIDSSTNGISLSCWVYATNPSPSYPNFDGIAGFRNESDCDFYLLQLSSSSVECRFRNSLGTHYTATITGFQINTWQHLVVTYDGSSLKGYLNGSLSASASASGLISSKTDTMYLGRLSYQGTHFQLDGKLDEVGLWDKALTASEIGCMYQYGHDTSSAGLRLFYQFNQIGNKTARFALDSKGHIHGNLNGFALSGSSSNFITGKVSFTHTDSTICIGDSILFGSQYYSQPGSYMAYIPVGSCDSIAYLNLSTDSPDTSVTVVNDTVLKANVTGAAYQWVDCNTGLAVPGATQRQFTSDSSGSYAVVVSVGSCSDTSSCFTTTHSVNTSSLNESILAGVSLYPNPSTGGTIQLLQNGLVHKGILNISRLDGALLYSTRINAPKTIVKHDLKRGLYLVSFHTETGAEKLFKLVVE